MYEKQKYLLLGDIDLDIINQMRKDKVIIAGGAVRSVFAGEYISDYDLYFRNKESADSFKNFIGDYKDGEYFLAYKREGIETYYNKKITFQIITMSEMFLPTPKELINQFDYTICMGAYDFETESFTLGDLFLEHLARRELYFNINAQYPLCSMFRLKKYFKKGYKISGTEIIKLGLSINNLKMVSYLDLRKQLMGIDTLFLKELTDTLLNPEYNEKEYDFNTFMDLVSSYYGDILEEMFSGSEVEKNKEATNISFDDF